MKKLLISITLLTLVGCIPQNEYKARGELYQCFVDGNAIYKSNVRPEPRGGQWVKLGDQVVEVDDCFCMGCVGF